MADIGDYAVENARGFDRTLGRETCIWHAPCIYQIYCVASCRRGGERYIAGGWCGVAADGTTSRCLCLLRYEWIKDGG